MVNHIISIPVKCTTCEDVFLLDCGLTGMEECYAAANKLYTTVPHIVKNICFFFFFFFSCTFKNRPS